MATATITPDQTAVIAEIFIAAPPARVFQAISDPSQLPKWWGQTGLYHVTKSTMDVRPGGKWRSDGVGADGKTFYVEGEYLEVDPPRLLVHTWIASYSGPEKTEKTVVRWELVPHSIHGLGSSGPRKSGTGTAGPRPPGRFRHRRIGHQPWRRLEASPRLARSLRRRRRNRRHEISAGMVRCEAGRCAANHQCGASRPEARCGSRSRCRALKSKPRYR